MTPRFAFAGTPEFAARTLVGLLRQGLRPVYILTGADQPRGRGRKTEACAVKRLALAEGIPVVSPTTKAEATTALAGLALDTVVVAAYRLILPPAFLGAPRYGCVNVHASLLPRWRGAAPIERALMAGDRETGVSIMRIDEGLDTGPIFAQAKIPIDDMATGAGLGDAIAELGAKLLAEVLPRRPHATPRPQAGKATYAHKLTRRDALADWRRPAPCLGRAIRALAHRMPVHSLLGGARVQLLDAQAVQTEAKGRPGEILKANRKEILVACGEGTLRLKSMRLNLGKGSVLGPAEALNGFAALFQTGALFAEP